MQASQGACLLFSRDEGFLAAQWAGHCASTRNEIRENRDEKQPVIRRKENTPVQSFEPDGRGRSGNWARI